MTKGALQPDELTRDARTLALVEEIPLWVAMCRVLNAAYRADRIGPEVDLNATITAAWQQLTAHLLPDLRQRSNACLARELKTWLVQLQQESARLETFENDLRARRARLADAREMTE